MSFYTQDDDFYSTQETTENDTNLFVCMNCGGTESYIDSTTGLSCCSSCFTQSQTQPLEEEGLDVEEVQGLAARTRGGQYKSAKLSKRKGRREKKQSLQELDNSVVLPNLVTCLHGMQSVLQQGIHHVSRILRLKDEQRRQVRDIVFKLWKNYLTSWMSGAEHYGKLHPEVRFSLRDAFVTKHVKTMVMRHLSQKCANEALKIKEEQEDDDTLNYESDVVSRRVNEYDDESPNITASDQTPPREARAENVGSSQSPSWKRTSPYKYQQYYSKIQSVLNLYPKNRGRKEAALRSQPTMTFCTALLWISIQSLGISAQHVVSWIANGSLPYLNAFGSCLSTVEQDALRPLSLVFKMSQPPTVRLLEHYAQLLMVACGYKPIPREKHSTSNLPDEKETQQKNSRKRYNATKKKQKQAPLSFVSPESVPIMAARFVDDLGLGQEVLDKTLALMGVNVNRVDSGEEAPLTEATKKDKRKPRLPAALPGARVENMTCPADILSVVVVACKMSRAWEGWSLRQPVLSQTDRETTESEEEGFVPWNEEQFRLLGNGPMAAKYVKFMEETYLEYQEVIPEYKDVLEKIFEDNGSRDDNMERATAQQGPVVCRNHILAGGHNPNRPNIWKRQKLHDWNLTLGKRKAQWADANGLGEYVFYNSDTNGAVSVSTSSIHCQPKNTRDNDYFVEGAHQQQPLHGHYGLLLEHMAYTTHVEPSEIHEKVTKLEKELISSVKPKVMPRKGKRGRPPKAKAAANTDLKGTDDNDKPPQVLDLSVEQDDNTDRKDQSEDEEPQTTQGSPRR